MTGPAAFLASGALVCVSATAGVSLLHLRSRIDVTLAWALVASSVVVVTVLLAGAALNDLAVWVVLTLNVLLAAVLAAASLAAGHRPRLPQEGSIGSFRGRLVLEVRSHLWVSILVAAAVGELLWRLAIAYLMPPYANDALWYHLTTVAGWLQNGRIDSSEFSIWSTVYPYNGELLFTWPALLLGSDTFVDAVQLPFAVVGAVAVGGIGRTVGLSRRGAVAAGCLFLLAPVVLSQTTASYVDLIFIAFFLAALHFLLRFLAELRADAGGTSRAHLFLAGLAGGLALGTKSLGVVYVGVLTLLLAGHLLAAVARGRASASSLARLLILFVIPVLALGSYHYLETWVRFGNPFYPVRVAAFGLELFDGRSLDWFLATPIRPGPWREVWGQWRTDYFFLVQPRFHAYSYDDRTSGLGPLWSYLGLPLLLVFALRLYRTNRAMLLNLLLPVSVMFVLQPYRWWSRFTMILIAVGVIAIVAIVEDLPRRWSTPLKASVLVLVALGAFFPTVKIDGEFWATRIFDVARLPADERTVGRVALPGYRWVDRTPARATIGVDTSADFVGGQPYILAYPLFGPRFEHSVHALPQADLNAFQRAIAQKQIRYVFVHRGTRLDRWSELAQHAGCAQRIYDGPVYAGQLGRAYRIVPHCVWAPQA